MKILIAAVTALGLLSTVAHAEYLAPRRSPELRQQTVQKTAKSERAVSRSALHTTTDNAAVARGLGIDDVLAKVNGVYMTGLQRCYRKSLAVDPSVSGKIDLQFKVAADGRVSSNLQGDGIERCLSTLMSMWRFGVALDDSGMPVDASFRITLVLQ
jgi:hypothetical protein